ncbi:hypothetical protein ACFV5J_34445 [Streptomyces zaomyceticus]|uniref:hypothetical protein n=1 Tax=Streptomyces zaomyceticus TaxID=68286 RepID=UPI003663844F
MSIPVQQPAASPTPPPSGPNGRWMLGGTILGGGTVLGLAFLGAPWWAVTIVAVMTILATFGIMTLPEQSEHKRDIWMAVIRYRDRRAARKHNVPPPRRPRKASPGGSGNR